MRVARATCKEASVALLLVGRLDPPTPRSAHPCSPHIWCCESGRMRRLEVCCHSDAIRLRRPSLLPAWQHAYAGQLMARSGRYHKSVESLRTLAQDNAPDRSTTARVGDAGHVLLRARIHPEVVDKQVCALGLGPWCFSRWRSTSSSKSYNQARTCETLIEAMGMAIPEVTPQDARGFFEYCGYRRVTLPV
jgi:hypothetical protein